MRSLRVPALATLAALVLGAACRKTEAPAVTAAPAPAGALAAADLCAQHGVLQAVCTKCNPALIPVFQSKGDWCAEHAFPESFCPTCHPERGGRPLVAVSQDEAPADGTKIRFKTKETAALAGIETAPAVEDAHLGALDAVARIAYDATRVAHVNARAAGVVRTIHVDVGMRVRQGAPLVTIESAQVGAEQSQLRTAEARLAVAQANHERTQGLFDKGIVPSRDVQLSKQELEVAEADLESTRRALHVIGTTGEEGQYTLVAPLLGIVTHRDASLGTAVEVGGTLFEIVDPSSMWAEIDIREGDLALIRVGQSVVVTVDGLPGSEFRGHIDYIAPSIDPQTRTASARARLDNPQSLLRANMYGRAHIEVGDERAGVVVPKDAIQNAKGVSLAFVRLQDDLYETRRVRVGSRSGDHVHLNSGVQAGELVVTAGSFLLKTETLKGSIGAGCCEIDGK